MMRKMLSMILVVGFFLTALGIVAQGENSTLRAKSVPCEIKGSVATSFDGVAEIYAGTDSWVCSNITAYLLKNVSNFAVDDNETDNGIDSDDYDNFKFDASSLDASIEDKGICVGATRVNGVNYVFVTDFTVEAKPGVTKESQGICEITEWEPIPTPIVYAKGDGWINISIPKFTNPQKELYGNITPNVDNAIGFAVYRNGLFISNTTSFNATHYFYNDTEISATVTYYYSVAVIVNGNYTTYGKSSDVKLQDGKPLQVMLNSPTGGKVWTGGYTHDIVYTITGGSPPYNVVICYSTAGGAEGTFTTIDEITHNEEITNYSYDWLVPEIDSTNMVVVRINVTDYALLTDPKTSPMFTIDSTAPEIGWTTPKNGATNVSIKQDITIHFDEETNQSATSSAFEISPDVDCSPPLWIDETTMVIEHDDFEKGETYICNITIAAKDDSDPGNYLGSVYSWSFTTAVGVGVSVLSPNTTSVWTGGSPHDIVYEIAGGEAPYEVNISYSGNVINTTTVYEEKKYTCPWNVPSNTDSKTAQVIVMVTDNVSSKAEYPSGNFEIDSTAPWIVTYSGNDTYITTTESITVVFSEEMNKASAESAFVLKDSSGNSVNGTFSWNGNAMSFVPNETLTPNMNYTATVNATAKDKSDPGNALDKDYSWNFIAIQGRGDFVIALDVPCSPEKGKTSTITVTVGNIGDEAFNVSGFLTVKFYASRDGVFSDEDLTDTKYIQNIWVGNSSSASTPFTFSDYGSYYFLVEVTSNNPADTFPGGEKTGRASASVNILKPAEEIGIGPYALIALMVLLVIVIGFLVIAGYKKEGKEAKKEGEEEKGEE